MLFYVDNYFIECGTSSRALIKKEVTLHTSQSGLTCAKLTHIANFYRAVNYVTLRMRRLLILISVSIQCLLIRVDAIPDVLH